MVVVFVMQSSAVAEKLAMKEKTCFLLMRAKAFALSLKKKRVVVVAVVAAAVAASAKVGCQKMMKET